MGSDTVTIRAGLNVPDPSFYIFRSILFLDYLCCFRYNVFFYEDTHIIWMNPVQR